MGASLHDMAGLIFPLLACSAPPLPLHTALTDLSGLPNVFALWLTHSEVVPAEVQCQQLHQAQHELPWLQEGDDITDCTRETGPASCVRCNSTA